MGVQLTGAGWLMKSIEDGSHPDYVRMPIFRFLILWLFGQKESIRQARHRIEEINREKKWSLLQEFVANRPKHPGAQRLNSGVNDRIEAPSNELMA